ncbi:hypothetical protein, partial [Streptomyces malaysiensis]|uniref:hypothetical protein n=1 Tax=Streptomyces malaysiensis TaxID=92644 RepID=UPI0031FBFEFD
MKAVTRKINGGTNGLADRQAKHTRYLAEYSDKPVKPGVPVPTPAPDPTTEPVTVAQASPKEEVQ